MPDKFLRLAGETQLELLRTFIQADRADELRREHCLLCRMVEGPEQVRAFVCKARNCGMVEEGRFRAEQQAIRAFFPVAAEPDLAAPEAIEAFNQHIMAAGCVTPAIERGPTGYLRRSVQCDSLLGLLHAALYCMLARQAGDTVDINAQMSKEEAARLIREARDRHKRDRDWAAASLVKWRVPKAAIARALGRGGKPVDPKTLDTMIERAEAERRRVERGITGPR